MEQRPQDGHIVHAEACINFLFRLFFFSHGNAFLSPNHCKRAVWLRGSLSISLWARIINHDRNISIDDLDDSVTLAMYLRNGYMKDFNSSTTQLTLGWCCFQFLRNFNQLLRFSWRGLLESFIGRYHARRNQQRSFLFV